MLHRLADVKHSVEQADQSRRDELPVDVYEGQFRRWLARRLTDEARNRYVVPEEAVVDQDERPDIRLMKPGVGPVSLELKIAERGWTIETLLERLEHQLVGQYMRDHGARCGIFVIGTQNRAKRYALPAGGPLVPFERLIELLSDRAQQLVAARFGRIHLHVIAIDFTQP